VARASRVVNSGLSPDQPLAVIFFPTLSTLGVGAEPYLEGSHPPAGPILRDSASHQDRDSRWYTITDPARCTRHGFSPGPPGRASYWTRYGSPQSAFPRAPTKTAVGSPLTSVSESPNSDFATHYSNFATYHMELHQVLRCPGGT
jgi:hypothetical protein